MKSNCLHGRLGLDRVSFCVISMAVVLLVKPLEGYADTPAINSVNEGDDLLLEEEYLLDDGLLFEDTVNFGSEEETSVDSHWFDGFKNTLEHSQTHIAGGLQNQRSAIRVEYEGAFAKGWYLRLDAKTQFFWHDDQLARAYDGDYRASKWQQAWIQYSQGACAVKIGRQNVIWGEVDGTFSVDIITPFDYTEQLFTDYGSIRLAQDMIFSECFFDKIQSQVFYTPDARTDMFHHHRSQSTLQLIPGQPPVALTVDVDQEWGGRLKFLGEGYDVSVMYARLYGNSPEVVVRGLIPQLDVAEFDFYGISSSFAIRRLLLKLDIGYRTNQLIRLSDNTGDRRDIAIGFEYTTSSNHSINAGIWQTEYAGDDFSPQSTHIVTAGWSKAYLNDNLSMSLLSNWSEDPDIKSITVLAEYQWDDYWNFSAAIGFSDSEESLQNSPLHQPDESLSLTMKYEF